MLEPCEMGESTVGVSHLVCVFSLLNGSAGIIVGFDEFNRQTVGHADTFARSSCCYKPHCCKVVLALALNFKRNLIVSSTNTSRTSLHVWLNVLHSLFEYF